MKTLKIITSLFLFLIMLSCSSDDDANNGPKGFFPTQIVATGHPNPNDDVTIALSYNLDNTISSITVTDGEGSVRTKNYSYANGRVTQVQNSGFLGGPDVRTFVYNTNGRLASIIDENSGEGSETFPVTYNATTNTYALVDGGDTFGIMLDATNNPVSYASTFLTSDLTLVLDAEDNGVFKNVSPQIALLFDVTFFNNGHLFYFFNQKQINNYQFGIQDFEVVNSRDANDNITVANFNFDTGVIQLNITYQNRNL